MSSFSDATAGMLPALQAAAGDSVVYSRFEIDSLPVVGVVDLQTYEVFDAQGLTTSVTAHEWLFDAAAFATAVAGVASTGEKFEPRSGDLITQTVGDCTQVFEVSPIAGKPTFEFADADGIMLIVRTKKLKNG